MYQCAGDVCIWVLGRVIYLVVWRTLLGRASGKGDCQLACSALTCWPTHILLSKFRYYFRSVDHRMCAEMTKCLRRETPMIVLRICCKRKVVNEKRENDQ